VVIAAPQVQVTPSYPERSKDSVTWDLPHAQELLAPGVSRD